MSNNFENSVDQKNTPIFFSKALGYTLYARTVADTPYDTGNLAYSISLKVNTPTRIIIVFPSSKAYYTEFLEEGTATHGKHKSFIRLGIVPNLAQQIKRYYSNELSMFPGSFDKRAFLSKVSKLKGHGSGRVTVGRSRYNRDTRSDRRQRSLRIFKGG